MNFKTMYSVCFLFAILLFVQCEKDSSLNPTPTSDRVLANTSPTVNFHQEIVWPDAIDNDRDVEVGFFNLTHIFNFGGFMPMPDVVCVTETSVETVDYDATQNMVNIEVEAVFSENTDEMMPFTETIILNIADVAEGTHTITPNTNTCYINTDNEMGFENQGLFTLGSVTISEITDTYIVGSYSIGNAMGGCVIDESMMFGLIEGDFQIYF